MNLFSTKMLKDSVALQQTIQRRQSVVPLCYISLIVT